MKKTDFIYFVLIVGFVAGAYFWYSGQKSVQQAPSEVTSEATLYETAEYGFSFSHSPDYLVTDTAEGLPQAVLKRITLIHKNDAQPRENSEGPTAISVEVSETSSGAALPDAVQNAPGSNFVLATGDILSATLSGKEALYYKWSGLYEGETVHVLHNGKLISFTVTYITPEDQIAAEYKKLLDSVVFR